MTAVGWLADGSPQRPLRPTIDRCVCQRSPFTALLDLARHHDWSLEQLIEETGCGDQCGMCRPYLRQMLSDGTTVFHHLLPLDEEAP